MENSVEAGVAFLGCLVCFIVGGVYGYWVKSFVDKEKARKQEYKELKREHEIRGYEEESKKRNGR